MILNCCYSWTSSTPHQHCLEARQWTKLICSTDAHPSLNLGSNATGVVWSRGGHFARRTSPGEAFFLPLDKTRVRLAQEALTVTDLPSRCPSSYLAFVHLEYPKLSRRSASIFDCQRRRCRAGIDQPRQRCSRVASMNGQASQ